MSSVLNNPFPMNKAVRSKIQPSEISQIKKTASRGAVWVTVTSAAALPMMYYRNWILSRIGSESEVVGQYALILLFVQIITTFGLFGGTTVTTNYLPKIKADRNKSAFIYSYAIISFIFCLFLISVLHIFPNLTYLLFNNHLDLNELNYFSITAPVVVTSQIVIFALVGLTEFRISSVLHQMQLILVCIFSTIAFFLFQSYLIENAILIFLSVVLVANAGVIVVGSIYILKRLNRIYCKFYFPDGFWRFSSFVHLNTFTTFAYQGADKVFILSMIGVKELGTYFILSQCSQLIRFVPDRIGQVMLSSFSRLIATDNKYALSNAYEKLCRIILILSTPIALFLIIFSQQVSSIFGQWCAERYTYLFYLAAIVSIGSLGGVNSMLIMSKEKAGLFLSNSIFLVGSQLVVTILLIKNYGVYAVIAGKAVGTIIGQIGLFSIIRWKLNENINTVPREYWVSILFILSITVVMHTLGPLKIYYAILIYIISISIYLLLVRIQKEEIIKILRKNQ